jgi:hypothetical protein
VSITRRGYKGSTPFSAADMNILASGADAEKIEFMKQRGLEIASFVDTFIQREGLHPISADGKKGGVALLGWSAGATFTASAIANVSALPPPVQARLASYIRAHIMQGLMTTFTHALLLLTFRVQNHPLLGLALPFRPRHTRLR